MTLNGGEWGGGEPGGEAGGGLEGMGRWVGLQGTPTAHYFTRLPSFGCHERKLQHFNLVLRKCTNQIDNNNDNFICTQLEIK